MGHRLQELEAKLDSFSAAVLRIVPSAADAEATARPYNQLAAQGGGGKGGACAGGGGLSVTSSRDVKSTDLTSASVVEPAGSTAATSLLELRALRPLAPLHAHSQAVAHSRPLAPAGSTACYRPVTPAQPLAHSQPVSVDILHRLNVARETLRQQVSPL